MFRNVYKQNSNQILCLDTQQGLMFGYATDETEECMPLTVVLAHRLNQKIAELRRSGVLSWARPDSKTQVSYNFGRDHRPLTLVFSWCLIIIRIFADIRWLQTWFTEQIVTFIMLTFLSFLTATLLILLFLFSLPGHRRIRFPEGSLHSTTRTHSCRIIATLREGDTRRTSLGNYGESCKSCDPRKVLWRQHHRTHQSMRKLRYWRPTRWRWFDRTQNYCWYIRRLGCPWWWCFLWQGFH